MPYASQSVLKCPSGEYITRMRTKNEYDQWLTGLELTCSDGSVVSAINEGDGPFGQNSYNNGVNVTARTYDTPNGFDSYNAQRVQYWTFNIDTYNQGVPVTKGGNVVDPSWSPDRTDFNCPSGSLVSGMNIWPCLGGPCSLYKVDSPICEGKTKPVNGGWSDWSSWSRCAANCGNVPQYRTRTCTNPAPANGGAACVGDAREDRLCPVPACPVDGGWSDWSSFSSCDATCATGGKGKQVRTRTCTNPAPSGTGAQCDGNIADYADCSIDLTTCPTDGGWSDWGSYDACLPDPSNPTTYRKKHSRTCTNPTPVNGGMACVGNSFEYSACEAPPVPTPVVTTPVVTPPVTTPITSSTSDTTVTSVTPTTAGPITTTSVVSPPVQDAVGNTTSTATTTHPDGTVTTTELLHDPNTGNVIDAKAIPSAPDYTAFLIILVVVVGIIYFVVKKYKQTKVSGGDGSMLFDTYYDGKLGGDYVPDDANIDGTDLAFDSIPSSVVY